MTYLQRHDLERGGLIRVDSWSNGKREGQIYIMNKNVNEEGGMEYEKAMT